ncbi:TM2 domain-containing protein [Bifidobacterium cuniculi]|uniref:TM2 domain-containing protein n=1 Tax=Bifidobacterium cuniculi TaxID=1688 RepID=A0A087AT21_9BIFI|nr:TM2 domain-containing protein [Bifidobacterium cuniculi]KFI61921.1 TM2 domain-containing protein [Bifidobacterium cuniculi]
MSDEYNNNPYANDPHAEPASVPPAAPAGQGTDPYAAPAPAYAAPTAASEPVEVVTEQETETYAAPAAPSYTEAPAPYGASPTSPYGAAPAYQDETAPGTYGQPTDPYAAPLPQDASGTPYGQPGNPYDAPYAAPTQQGVPAQGAGLPLPADYQVQPPHYVPRNKILAGLLALFFGTLGIHNFYLGYTGKAIAQLLLTVIGWIVLVGPLVSLVWSIVDGVHILTSDYGTPAHRDARGVELVD